MTGLSKDMERELAAVADGSLLSTSEHGKRVLERVSGSRELQAALAEQQRAIDLITGAEVPAPASLHHRVEAMLPPVGHGRRALRALPRPRVGLAAVGAAALAMAAVAVGLSERGSTGGLGVQQAAALTLRPATMPAPAESKANRSQLTVSVGGVSFPYWQERFGWSSSGARRDQLAGRSVTTVFYTSATGERIGYAIVSGKAPSISGGRTVRRWGVTYRLLTHDGATVVTWQRAGHLCVVSGRQVSARTLLRLAGWGSAPRVAA